MKQINSVRPFSNTYPTGPTTARQTRLSGLARSLPHALNLFIVVIASGAATACSDDDSSKNSNGATATGGVGGMDAGGSDASAGGGTGGGVGGGGTGGSRGESGTGPQYPLSCDPMDAAHMFGAKLGNDACLKCLATTCCTELGSGNPPERISEDDAGNYHTSFEPYDYFFACTRTCFDREVATDASTDADELLVACGWECQRSRFVGPPRDIPLDYGSRDLLACIAGEPRPVGFFGDSGVAEWREGEADADAGASAPNCLAECLPNWR